MPIVTFNPASPPSNPSFTGVTINDLNLGPNLGVNPLETVEFKQVLNRAHIRGAGHAHWSEGAEPIEFEGSIQVVAQTAIGGFAAGTQGALVLLLNQLQELVANPFLSPQYIQWDPSGPSPFDGWWLISDVKVTRWNKVAGRAAIYLKATFLLAGSNRRAAYYASGGARPSNLSQALVAATKAVWFPPSVSGANSYARTAAEGQVTAAVNPPVNPVPVAQPADPSSYWSGGCRVYDAGNITLNLAPMGAPLIPPTLTAAAGATPYHAGTFTVGYTYVFADGTESALSTTSQVVLTAGQQINVAALPIPTDSMSSIAAPTAAKFYFTGTVPGGDTAGFIVQQAIVGGQINAFSLTVEGNGVAAPTTAARFINANWIEVKHPELHRFANDIVITNGLVLLVFSFATGNVVLHFWSGGWQVGVQVSAIDAGPKVGTLVQFALNQISPEEVGFDFLLQTPVGNRLRPGHGLGAIESFRCRMQRGVPGFLFDYAPLTESAGDVFVAVSQNLNTWSTIASKPKIFSSSNVWDTTAQGQGGPNTTSDYGFAGIIWPDPRAPFVAAFHFQNQSGVAQGNAFNIPPSALQQYVKTGDGAPTAGTYRSYGVTIVPFGTNAAAIELPQGAPSGAVLSGGAVSAADAGTLTGNAAKIPNATAAGAKADLIFTNGLPYTILPAGTYALYYRARVTANASATAQLKVAVSTSGVDQVTATYAPTSQSTTYPSAWIRVGTFIADGVSLYDGYVTNTVPTTTDWWFDQLMLAPILDGTAATQWLQDLWSQFIYDLSTSLEVS